MKGEPPTPADPSSVDQRASILYKAGEIGAVIAIYEARVKDHPQDSSAWRKLSRLLIEAWQFAPADAAITRALAAFGADPALLALQVFAKQELGLSDQARELAVSAAERYPDKLSFQFDSRLLLPMVYADHADLVARRVRYEAGLTELESMLPAMQRAD